MNNAEKFNETVGILVKAYLNDTLTPANCAACAVGNIIAHKCGFSFIRGNGPRGIEFNWWTDARGERVRAAWPELVWGDSSVPDPDASAYQVSATGYTAEQLSQIEIAFMDADYDDTEGVGHYLKLMAVVDVLAKIHNIDLTTAEAAKALFVKA